MPLAARISFEAAVVSESPQVQPVIGEQLTHDYMIGDHAHDSLDGCIDDDRQA